MGLDQSGIVEDGRAVASSANASMSNVTEQTARRSAMPAHYSTGAHDPQIAVIRQMLERRRWTFRNLARMNALLGLVRLRINRRDVPTQWAQWATLLAHHLTDEPRAPSLVERPLFLHDGSPGHSLRKHPVAASSST